MSAKWQNATSTDAVASAEQTGAETLEPRSRQLEIRRTYVDADDLALVPETPGDSQRELAVTTREVQRDSCPSRHALGREIVARGGVATPAAGE